MKYFSYTIIGIVSLVIIAGFFIVGSPNEQRLRRFDETRINDLQQIQNYVANYWQAKQTLPKMLADLNDPMRYVSIPVDPSTKVAYEYRSLGEVQFELCATFDREGGSQGTAAVPVSGYIGVPLSDDWRHSAGHGCFTRTIDKDFYPPLKTQ